MHLKTNDHILSLSFFSAPLQAGAAICFVLLLKDEIGGQQFVQGDSAKVELALCFMDKCNYYTRITKLQIRGYHTPANPSHSLLKPSANSKPCYYAP